MAHDRLDATDIEILKNLQDNGRLTNVELAKNVGISAPPCLRRLKYLENEGVIQSYHAQLNEPLLGYRVIVFADVKLDSQNNSDLEAFEQQVSLWKCVRECYIVTGDSDFVLKIVAKNFDDYQNFLSAQLTKFSKVLHVQTKMVLKTTKKEFGIPLNVYKKD